MKPMAKQKTPEQQLLEDVEEWRAKAEGKDYLITNLRRELHLLREENRWLREQRKQGTRLVRLSDEEKLRKMTEVLRAQAQAE